MNKNTSYSTLAAVAMAFAFALVPAGNASALTISPPYFDYTLNPGDTMLDTIKLYNENTTTMTFYPTLRNFTYKSGDETGTPEFYPPDQNPDGTGLAQWIKTDLKPVTLEGGGRAQVSFAINVPKDQAQPGGHYGAILFSTAPPQADGSVGLASQIGALILLRVSGDVKEDARLAEFGFANKQVWYNYRPIDMYVRVENDGNVHLRPTGDVFIKNWYGRQVATVKVNDEFSSVLPHSIRKYEFSWTGNAPLSTNGGFFAQLGNEWNNFGFGRYTAELVLTYGTHNQIIGDVRQFTIWPWRLMLVSGILLLVLIAFFTVGLKWYNRAVIKRYERMQNKR
jgi:hypothetical protein